eukprot:6811000-Lingulodinium_polyedra.AAC.1
MAAVSWLRSLGDVPAIVAGGNLAVTGTGTDATLAMSGGLAFFQHAGPTCQPSNGAPSRIDRVYANRGARAW